MATKKSKVDGNRTKTGGRTKGTPNKLTEDARRVFLETLEGEVPHIHEAFAKVREKSPDKYLDLFAKYAQYFVPKKTENTDKVEHTFKDFNLKESLKFDNPES